MKFETKIKAAAAAIILVMLTGALLPVIVNRQVDVVMAELKSASDTEHLHITLLDMLLNAETGQRDFVVTGNEHFLEPYHMAVNTIPATQGALRKAQTRPAEQARLAAIERATAAKLHTVTEAITLRREKGFDAAARLIASGEVLHDGQRIGATASIGVASYPTHGHNMQTLVHAADLALYEAKHEGRNCVRAAKAEASLSVEPNTADSQQVGSTTGRRPSAAALPHRSSVDSARPARLLSLHKPTSSLASDNLPWPSHESARSMRNGKNFPKKFLWSPDGNRRIPAN